MVSGTNRENLKSEAAGRLKSEAARGLKEESFFARLLRRAIGIFVVVASISIGWIYMGPVFLLEPERPAPAESLNSSVVAYPKKSSPLAEAGAAVKLNFFGDFVVSTGTRFKKFTIGGLSGLTFDSNTKRILTISDDRGRSGPPRWFEWGIDSTKPVVNPLGVVVLLDKSGKAFKDGELDPEGIALWPGKGVVVSSEGNIGQGIPPRLLLFSRTGRWLKDLPLPNVVLAKDPESKTPTLKGARDNQALEGLTIDPSHRWMYVAVEGVLEQDGPVSTREKGGVVRILEYDLSESEAPTAAQLAVELSPLPKAKTSGEDLGINGVSDILALSQRRFLLLERAYLLARSELFVKLFLVDCLKAEDISHLSSLEGHSPKKCEKELVLDFNREVEKFSHSEQRLDNLEGLTWIPWGAKKVLALVSDNNFRQEQQTQWIFYSLISEK